MKKVLLVMLVALIAVSAVFAEFEHSDLYLGADAFFFEMNPMFSANAVFTYHINENNSVFAKVVLPVDYELLLNPTAISEAFYMTTSQYGAIGYSYNF